MPLNWTQLLDPANGGPGEPPGYQETVSELRNNPRVRVSSDTRKTRPKPKKR